MQDGLNLDLINEGRWQAVDSAEVKYETVSPLSSSNGASVKLNGILKTCRVEDMYYIGKVLGEGKYGVVRIVEKKCFDKIRFAMKEINVESDQADF